jgi:hypothetical protein
MVLPAFLPFTGPPYLFEIHIILRVPNQDGILSPSVIEFVFFLAESFPDNHESTKTGNFSGNLFFFLLSCPLVFSW